MKALRWLGRLIREYAVVIAAMLVAGMVMGACAVVQTKPPLDLERSWNDPPPIKPMPNYVKHFNHERMPYPRWA